MPAKVSDVQLQKKRVLLLDDEPDILTLAEINLELEGFDVVAQQMGKQGYSISQIVDEYANSKVPIDCIVTDFDYKRGDETGVKLIQAFRKIRPDVPAVIMSGTTSDAKKALEGAGIDNVHVLTKPACIIGDTIAKQVRQALGGSDQARAL